MKKHPSNLIFCWFGILAELDFTITHVPSRESTIADFLSYLYEIFKLSKISAYYVVRDQIDSGSSEAREVRISFVHSLGHFGEQTTILKIWTMVFCGLKCSQTLLNRSYNALSSIAMR